MMYAPLSLRDRLRLAHLYASQAVYGLRLSRCGRLRRLLCYAQTLRAHLRATRMG